MSVRPPPSMTVAFSGAALSPPIFSILLPTTRTEVLAVSLSDLPSNTFTFLNRVALSCFASILPARHLRRNGQALSHVVFRWGAIRTQRYQTCSTYSAAAARPLLP